VKFSVVEQPGNSAKVVSLNHSINPIGRHIIADFWGARSLSDPEGVGQKLEWGGKNEGATVLVSHMNHFEYRAGVTGVVILAESHISVHTWPEYDYAAFDIFVCGNARPSIAIQVLKEELLPTRVDQQELSRGDIKMSMAMQA